ncbi:16072_t:CDS:2 [Entrophospora sp. SA101]|nr:16072_t:CDS:2 [Entrophospora sp. SA101]
MNGYFRSQYIEPIVTDVLQHTFNKFRTSLPINIQHKSNLNKNFQQQFRKASTTSAPIALTNIETNWKTLPVEEQPSTINKEWEEATTEKLIKQKADPISGIASEGYKGKASIGSPLLGRVITWEYGFVVPMSKDSFMKANLFDKDSNKLNVRVPEIIVCATIYLWFQKIKVEIKFCRY